MQIKTKWDSTSDLSERLFSKRQEMTNVGEDVEKGILVHCWWEPELVQPTWKTEWRCLLRLRTEVPYDSPIPFLGYIWIWKMNMKEYVFKEYENINQKRCLHPHVHWGSIYDIKIWKKLKCLLWDEWIKVVLYSYIYIIIKRWNHAICYNMDGPWGYLSCEINGEKQFLYDFTHM